MKKHFISISFALIIFTRISGQDDIKKIDFILVVDNNIAVGTIAQLQIEISSDKKKETIDASYYPGNLSLKKNNFDRIMSDSTKSINLKFTYYEYLGKSQIAHQYDIEMKKEWLQDYFIILHVYDLNKKQYKEKYYLNKTGENYVYEIESPSYSFKLIQRKK